MEHDTTWEAYLNLGLCLIEHPHFEEAAAILHLVNQAVRAQLDGPKSVICESAAFHQSQALQHSQ